MLVFIGGLIVIVLFGALIGPYFINWTDYRSDFERETSRLLGQPVTVNGTAEVRLIPVPSITFSDVQLGDVSGDGPRISVRSFGMDMELAPLLSGDVKIIDMRIDGADAQLTLKDDSTLDWNWALGDGAAAADIELENVAISNSRIRIRQSAQARDIELLAINGKLSANSLLGPWQGEGRALFAGQDYKGTFSTSTFGGNQPGRIRFDVQPEDEAYRLQVQGQIERDAAGLAYVGEVALDTDLAFGASDDTLQLRARGPFKMDQKAAIITPLRIEAGPSDDPYVAEGNGSLFLEGEPRFALSLDGQQINLDRISDTGKGDRVVARDLSPFQRFYEQFSAVVTKLPKPRLSGDIALNIPAVTQGAQAYRNISLNVTPSAGGWSFKKFAGDLPGRTRLEGSGLLSIDEAVSFEGEVIVASRQPTGLAQWLTGRVDDDIRKLPALGFSSGVSLSERRQNFRGLELQLGQDTLTGLVDRVVSQDPQSQKRPIMVFRLNGDSVNLDALLAFGRLVRNVAGTDESTHDLDVAIKAKMLNGFGTVAENVAAEFIIDETAIAVKNLSIDDLSGADIVASADIKNIYQTPNGAFNLAIGGDDLAPSIALLQRLSGNHPFLVAMNKRAAIDDEFFKEASLFVEGESLLQDERFDLKASLNAVLGGTELEGQIIAEGTDIGTAQGRIELNAGNESGERILSLLGVPSLPLDTISRLDLNVVAEGALNTGLRVAADISGLESEEYARFDGLAQVKDGALSGDGMLSLALNDADPYVAALNIELPGTGLGKGVSINSRTGLAGGVLTFEALNGRLGSVDIAGDMVVDMTADRPLIKGALFASEFDIALFMDALWGQGYRFASTLDGGSLLRSNLDFAAGISSSMDFDLTLRAREIMFADLMAGRDAKLKLTLNAAGGSIEDLETIIEQDQRDGIISGAVFAQNENGQLTINGQFDAENMPSKSVLSNMFSVDVLDGALSLSGSVAGRGSSFETLISGLTGSGTLSLNDGRINGIRETDIADYLTPSDAQREGLTAEAIDALVETLTLNGTLALPIIDATFSIVNGRLRLPPLTLDLDQSVINADISASLAQSEIDLSARLQLDAGKEAQSGSVPAIEFAYQGAFDAAALDVSTQPLTQFLQQRALEREQIRVAKRQVALLEKQRLRREIRYFRFLNAEEARKEEERLQKEREEEARLKEEARIEAEKRQQEADAAARALNDTQPSERVDAIKNLIEQATKPTNKAPATQSKAQPSTPKITQFPQSQF